MIVEIQDERTIGEIARLTAATGKTVSDIVSEAISAQAERLPLGKAKSYEEFRAAVREIQDHIAKLPVLDDRSADEIIGYNEHGHFD